MLKSSFLCRSLSLADLYCWTSREHHSMRYLFRGILQEIHNSSHAVLSLAAENGWFCLHILEAIY